MSETDLPPKSPGPKSTEPKSPGLPSNVRLLEQPASDIIETLDLVREHADEIAGIIVIGLNKDGTQSLISSSMSQIERCFLISFANSYVHHWFKPEAG